MHDKLSDLVDKFILDAIKTKSDIRSSSFEELISFGELVDRLSIVNYKLYKLKDDVLLIDDEKFKAWASVEDIKLVKERSRLKKCIDEKILHIISKFIDGDKLGGFNPEVKKYGKLE